MGRADGGLKQPLCTIFFALRRPCSSSWQKVYACPVVYLHPNIKLPRPQLTLSLAGTNPSEIKVPYDIPTMKEKLFIWLSTTVDHLNQDWSGVEHCWKETDLLRAWYAYTSNVLHICM